MELFSWSEFFAGCIGGASGVVVGHPFDTIKVRMQTGVEKLPAKTSVRSPTSATAVSLAHLHGVTTTFSTRAFSSAPPRAQSMLKTAAHMFRQEGWQSFYRGMSFPLLSAGVQNAIFFATYQKTLNFLGADRRENQPNTESRSSHYKSVFAAGCLAGVAQLGLAVPIDVVKTRLQVKTDKIQSRQFKKAIETFASIARNEGWRALYRGAVPQAVCMVPGFGVYMLVYYAGLDACRRIDKNTEKCDRTWAVLLAGGFAGMISWQVCLPFDVVKTKMQSAVLLKRNKKLYLNGTSGTLRGTFSPLAKIEVLSLLRQIYRDEGWRGFTRGFVPVSLRAFPTNVAVFGLYELSYAYFSSIRSQAQLT